MLALGAPTPALDAEGARGERLRWPGGAGALLLCFVRPVSSPFGRAALRRLTQLRGLAGLQIAAVTPSGAARAQGWARQEDLPFPLIADPEARLARAWRQGRDRWGLYSLRGLSQGDLGGASLRAALAAGQGWPERDGGWLPSELLIDARGLLVYARLGCTRLSSPDLMAIRAAAARIRS